MINCACVKTEETRPVDEIIIDVHKEIDRLLRRVEILHQQRIELMVYSNNLENEIEHLKEKLNAAAKSGT